LYEAKVSYDESHNPLSVEYVQKLQLRIKNEQEKKENESKLFAFY